GLRDRRGHRPLRDRVDRPAPRRRGDPAAGGRRRRHRARRRLIFLLRPPLLCPISGHGMGIGPAHIKGETQMSYSTIYDLDGNIITDGVQSQRVCDATINAARRLAADRKRSVVVEDRGTEECYRVTPSGLVWRAPKGWINPFEAEDEDEYE